MKSTTLTYLTQSTIQTDRIGNCLRSAGIDATTIAIQPPREGSIQRVVANHSSSKWRRGTRGFTLGGVLGAVMGSLLGALLGVGVGHFPVVDSNIVAFLWITAAVGAASGMGFGMLAGLKVAMPSLHSDAQTLREFGREITVSAMSPSSATVVRGIFERAGAIRMLNPLDPRCLIGILPVTAGDTVGDESDRAFSPQNRASSVDMPRCSDAVQ